MRFEIYDLIIIGSGPAGLTAAIYATRYKLKTLVITKGLGLAFYAHKIENYPGFPNISGMELLKRIEDQAKTFNIRIIKEEVKEIKKRKYFLVVTGNKIYKTKTIILASGTERKKLNIPNEEKFIGKGVSYCATCDAPLFKNKIVAVIGGGNSAVMSALLLAEYAKKIYLIYRGKELKAEPIQIERLKKNKKIKILYNSGIKEIKGKNFVESIILNNKKKLNVQGIFIEIGNVPVTYFLKKIPIQKDKEGFILTNQAMETNIKGIFAAGDIRKKTLRQIVTAASDGAIAAFSAYSYLKSKKPQN
ncbi:MAG: thioredoxin-disulfide reductase [Candidatus Pacearchaeota archaeon]